MYNFYLLNFYLFQSHTLADLSLRSRHTVTSVMSLGGPPFNERESIMMRGLNDIDRQCFDAASRRGYGYLFAPSASSGAGSSSTPVRQYERRRSTTSSLSNIAEESTPGSSSGGAAEGAPPMRRRRT